MTKVVLWKNRKALSPIFIQHIVYFLQSTAPLYTCRFKMLDLLVKQVLLCIAMGLNALVLIPVLVMMTRNGKRSVRAYGEDTAAKRILACIYGAILVVSAALFVLIIMDNSPYTPLALSTSPVPPGAASYWAQSLLGVQITYKLCTTFAVGFKNPVVISNVCIAAFHIVVLAVSIVVDVQLAENVVGEYNISVV